MKTFIALAFVITYGIVHAVSAAVGTNTATGEYIVRELEYRDVRTPYLLAFKAQVDDRPLYVESALLAMELTNKTWRFVHVYRHPKERVEHFHHWKVAAVTDVPYTGSQDFDRRPTKTEVEKFIRDTWWEFRASRDFRLVRGEVYSDTWKKALGYDPKYEFNKPAA